MNAHEAKAMFRRALYVALGVSFLLLGWNCACCDKPPVTGPPVPPVIVEKRCVLPPKPLLPTPKAHRPGDGGLIAFTPEEALKLHERDAKLKQWIREVLARCSDVRLAVEDAGSPDARD